MLAISRGLLSRPKLLLLDEPSLGLAPLLVKEIFTIVRRLNDEEGISILLVEQNAHMALETARYGYVLEVGRVRHGRHLRAACRQPGHPGILSRRQGDRRARRTPLEAKEDVAMRDWR